MHPTLLLAALTAGLLGGLGSGHCAQAQTRPDTTAFATSAPSFMRQVYAASVPLSAQLYNGTEYVNYALLYTQREGDQFFLSAEPQAGSIYYNGHLFESQPLRYDVVLDQVVLNQPTSPLQIRLVSEKLPRFTIGPHRFVRLYADSTASVKMPTGYYEMLSEGQVQLLARRAKREQKELSHRTVKVKFVVIDRLFARKKGTYYAVSSKSGALRLFADRATEVQAYLRQNKLKMSKRYLEASLKRLTDYYNQLPPR